LTPVSLFIAAPVAAGAAALAWSLAALTLPGAAAAAVIGAMVLAGTGWEGGAVLAVFFTSSSLLSRLAPPPSGLDPKGDRRDHRQVAANGGPAAISALLGLHDPYLGLWLLTGGLAAAAADTWATSVGALSRTPPRLLWGGRRVPPGTSGGVTLLGSLGGAAGAAVVSGVGALGGSLPMLFPVGTLIGFAGMLADSLLGATAQARFRCPGCGVPSEWPRHRCGGATTLEGGIRWLDNDRVNLVAIGLATGVAAAAWAWSG